MPSNFDDLNDAVRRTAVSNVKPPSATGGAKPVVPAKPAFIPPHVIRHQHHHQTEHQKCPLMDLTRSLADQPAAVSAGNSTAIFPPPTTNTKDHHQQQQHQSHQLFIENSIKKKSNDLNSRMATLPTSSSSVIKPLIRGGVVATSSTSSIAKVSSNNFFQQSSKQLEQLLAQRFQKESSNHIYSRQLQPSPVLAAPSHKNIKKRPPLSVMCIPPPLVMASDTDQNNKSECATTDITTTPATSTTNNISSVQKQIQHKLHDEMRRHCRQMQDTHFIERRWPQQQQKQVMSIYFCPFNYHELSIKFR